MSRAASLLARLGAICQRSCSALTEASTVSAPSCSYSSLASTVGQASRLRNLAQTVAPLGTFSCSPSYDLHAWREYASRSRPAPPAPNYVVSLGNLRDNPGATRQRVRVGRGDGGRRGNYSGRGMKGQKQRGRGLHMLFDGGQLGLLKFPVIRQRPPYQVLYYHLGLSRVVEFVQLGLLDPTRTITMKDLYDTGCITRNIKYGVMLYGTARLSFPLDIQVTACDADTHSCVQAAKGRVVRVYYTLEGLAAILHPEKYTRRRLPLPLPAAGWHPKYDKQFDVIGQIPPNVTRSLLPPDSDPALATAASTQAVATA